jgi:hypothetical protein
MEATMSKPTELEQCSKCNELTEKAGIGEDSLTIDGVNPLCEKCFDLGEKGVLLFYLNKRFVLYPNDPEGKKAYTQIKEMIEGLKQSPPDAEVED